MKLTTETAAQSDTESLAALRAAVNRFLLHSPRYCELNDKYKANKLFCFDEQQELIALRQLFDLTK